MDIRYRISGGFKFVSDSVLVSPPLLPDSKALRSESDIFATSSAKGSCGVDPGPVQLRMETLSASAMGDWL
jgi:hypothetical protein